MFLMSWVTALITFGILGTLLMGLFYVKPGNLSTLRLIVFLTREMEFEFIYFKM